MIRVIEGVTEASSLQTYGQIGALLLIVGAFLKFLIWWQTANEKRSEAETVRAQKEREADAASRKQERELDALRSKEERATFLAHNAAIAKACEDNFRDLMNVVVASNARLEASQERTLAELRIAVTNSQTKTTEILGAIQTRNSQDSKT